MYAIIENAKHHKRGMAYDADSLARQSLVRPGRAILKSQNKRGKKTKRTDKKVYKWKNKNKKRTAMTHQYKFTRNKQPRDENITEFYCDLKSLKKKKNKMNNSNEKKNTKE